MRGLLRYSRGHWRGGGRREGVDLERTDKVRLYPPPLYARYWEYPRAYGGRRSAIAGIRLL